jgi:hypothetical protein
MPAPALTSPDAQRRYPPTRPVRPVGFPGRMSGFAKNHMEMEDWQVSMKAQAPAFLLLDFAVGNGTSLAPPMIARSAKPFVSAPHDCTPCSPYRKFHPHAPQCHEPIMTGRAAKLAPRYFAPSRALHPERQLTIPSGKRRPSTPTLSPSPEIPRATWAPLDAPAQGSNPRPQVYLS